MPRLLRELQVAVRPQVKGALKINDLRELGRRLVGVWSAFGRRLVGAWSAFGRRLVGAWRDRRVRPPADLMRPVALGAGDGVFCMRFACASFGRVNLLGRTHGVVLALRVVLAGWDQVFAKA